MAFSKINRKGMLFGIIFVAMFAAVATVIAGLYPVKTLGISPLVIGIVMGMVYANTLHNHLPSGWGVGITFSGKKILRFAIILYGFRITFQQIMAVGMSGFMISFIMLSSTFLLGSYVGMKVFKMDRDTAMLTAVGGAVCGAAAVLATEPVLKSEGHKTAVAVSMVVLFGTISMFLYPVLYASIIEPAVGFFHMTPKQFGMYVGSTIHEVAQVVAVPSSVQGTPVDMANAAVIIKMTRVIMIAPMLIMLGMYLSIQAKKKGKKGEKLQLVIPWFAVYFIVTAGFHSLDIVSHNIVAVINQIDTFLLTMAMSALGMGTIFAKFKGLGLAPLYTAGSMFIWLVVGGFIITKIITSFF